MFFFSLKHIFCSICLLKFAFKTYYYCEWLSCRCWGMDGLGFWGGIWLIPLKCGGLQTLLKCRSLGSFFFFFFFSSMLCFTKPFNYVWCFIFPGAKCHARLTTQLEPSIELFNRSFTQILWLKSSVQPNEGKIDAEFYLYSYSVKHKGGGLAA